MVNIRPLSAELQKIAIDELFEDPARIEKDLETFREWLKKSPHIISRTDDQFLVNFMRGCKYRMEVVKQKFDLYHTLKTHVPELTRNRDPLDKKTLGVIREGVGIVLPKPTPDSPSFILFRPGCYDPSKYTIIDVMKVSTMMMDLMMIEDDNYVIAGQSGVGDFSGSTLAHFLQFNPSFMKKMTMLQQDAMPIRQKAMHFVNMPAVALTTFNLFQTFMNEKNKSRMFLYGHDMEALCKKIPREILPTEYGGKAGTIQELIDKQEKWLIENRDFFLEDDKYGVDEKKRVGRPKNSDSLFGVDGTFRQLTID